MWWREALALAPCERLGWVLLHFVWQAAGIVAAVRLIELLLPPRRGSPRYLLYTAALLAMPLAAAATLSAPQGWLDAAAHRVVVSVRLLGPVARSIHDPLLVAVLPWLVIIWSAGVLVGLGRLLLCAGRVRRLREGVGPLPPALARRLPRLVETLGMSGFCRVFVSARVEQPLVFGLVKPVVLLPASLVTRLPTDMLEAIIAHELAHIRRFDLWVNLSQRLVETAFFYHPAVWWLSRRVSAERELCCDARAVRVTRRAVRYAQTLERVAWAELAGRLPGLSPALPLNLAFAQTSLLDRVAYVLGRLPNRRATPSAVGAAVCGAVTVAGLCGVAVLQERVEAPGALSRLPIRLDRDAAARPYDGWVTVTHAYHEAAPPPVGSGEPPRVHREHLHTAEGTLIRDTGRGERRRVEWYLTGARRYVVFDAAQGWRVEPLSEDTAALVADFVRHYPFTPRYTGAWHASAELPPPRSVTVQKRADVARVDLTYDEPGPTAPVGGGSVAVLLEAPRRATLWVDRQTGLLHRTEADFADGWRGSEFTYGRSPRVDATTPPPDGVGTLLLSYLGGPDEPAPPNRDTPTGTDARSAGQRPDRADAASRAEVTPDAEPRQDVDAATTAPDDTLSPLFAPSSTETDPRRDAGRKDGQDGQHRLPVLTPVMPNLIDTSNQLFGRGPLVLNDTGGAGRVRDRFNDDATFSLRPDTLRMLDRVDRLDADRIRLTRATFDRLPTTPFALLEQAHPTHRIPEPGTFAVLVLLHAPLLRCRRH